MALQIASQSSMDAARKLLTTCYICGGSLPTTRDQGAVLREHVIPKSLLGVPPAAEQDRWPVILDVHTECEETLKRGNDHFVSVINRMLVSGPHSLGTKDRGFVKSRVAVNQSRIPGLGIRAVANVKQSPIAASVLWVRGLHAALYGRVLEADTKGYVGAPTPIAEDGTPFNEAEWGEKRWAAMLAIEWSQKYAKTDNIRAWGGAVAFDAVWIDLGDKPQDWTCFWTLCLPNVAEWSAKTLGYSTPWHGLFFAHSPPPSACIVTLNDLNKWGEFEYNRARAGLR